MKISVIGIGYVGLVTAVCLAEKENEVICYDINKEKIELLNSGKSPIYEQDIERLINNNKQRITFTTDKNEVYKDGQVIFICVETPQSEDGSANLTFVYKVVDDIIGNLKNDCLIIIKSTVPVGTTKEIDAYVNERINKKYKVEVAFNPEFLAQGTAIRDTLNAQRIIIGANSEWAKSILKQIYANFDKSVMLYTDSNTAEMTKYAANNYLALKISYINEVANLCEILNANIDDVAKGMGLDKRIGSEFLKAGIGYGGSCFPKDTNALYTLAKDNDYELKTVKSAIEVNEKQKYKLLEKLKKYYSSDKDLTIAVIGLAFKTGTNDLRESPAIYNIKKLPNAHIKAWDSVVNELPREIKNVTLCNTIDETIENADICFIFTEWEEIKKYDIEKYQKLMKTPIILDGRNCYRHEAFKTTNIIYESIGREIINND